MDDKQKKYSILDELKNSSGYDIALMTTFNFEVGFFERAVLNRLYARDIRKISIFVDSKQLNEALKDVSTSFIGRKYMVNPVEMQGSFHPKVILLLGKDRAKLVVGSANIKTSGYSINNEIFNFIEYSSKNPGYLDVINAAIDFFIRINQESYQLDNKILEEAKKQIYYHPTKSNGECFLLDNISKSIFSQVTDIIKEPIDEVKVAVPYYDRELAALKSIKETYSTADIQLYIQNKTSSFPVDLNKKEHITKRIEVFSGFSDGKQPSVDNFYHGKVFLFKGKNRDYILYGSANCTNSALIKSYKDGGNIECNLLEIGANSDFDYFFDSINIIQVDELKSRPMTFESEPVSNYFYKYGKINKGAELHIGYYKKPDKLSVRIGDLEFDYEYVKKELVVYIPEEYEPLVYDIFDICMISGNTTEKVHCWCFNNTELDGYRSKSTDKGFLDDFDIHSSGDKYIEDRMNLLNAEAAGLPEILEYKKNRAAFLQIQREQDGDETEYTDNDDFVVDMPVTDEYKVAYKQYSIISKIRHQFIRNFISGDISVLKMLEKSSSKQEFTDGIGGLDNKDNQIRPRKATTEEKRFERFVKHKIKGMLNDKYVEIIEAEHYFGIIAVILDIFNKYSNDDYVEDIFTNDYVFETRIQLFSKLISKEFEESEEFGNLKEVIITKCLSIILENHLMAINTTSLEESSDIENKNKRFLMLLEKQYSLRNSYQHYIKRAIDNGESVACTLGHNAACKYIENLYGYKTQEQLISYIKEKYPNASVDFKEKTLRISLKTESLKDYNNPSTAVLKEIARYSTQISRIDYVYIDIENIANIPENKNTRIKIRHHIDMQYRKWKLTEEWKSGLIDTINARYIAF